MSKLGAEKIRRNRENDADRMERLVGVLRFGPVGRAIRLSAGQTERRRRDTLAHVAFRTSGSYSSCGPRA